ncbi:DinB family protein [Pedobacter gandavensis]|uniref:Damage-inducible protein DinB n=1 Tax=Pedobacter gandavensis TaxID=2679963 RepID=A0ABR6ESI4_9SPHI|nr:DinB family protein [Pedobacter gandavensis]MBB2148221.1 damage-inducible protein DinB [Pedobacter gandavensis]
MNTTTASLITSEELLAHWQGHRALTRRVIEAFPEKELFNYSIGGMRSFSGMVMELLGIGAPGIQEIATGQINPLNEHFEGITQKEQLLKLWDEATEKINTYWPQISEDQFSKVITIFGQYEGTTWSSIFYFIDNEIHHRGEGYVYLRSLGITPPFFYERP